MSSLLRIELIGIMVVSAIGSGWGMFTMLIDEDEPQLDTIILTAWSVLMMWMVCWVATLLGGE